MYRQHVKNQYLRTMSDVQMPSGVLDLQIVSHMSNLPIVHSACGQLFALYQNTKDSNKLLKYTLETAETGVKSVATTAMPIVNKLEKPISVLDTIACDSLGRLEQRVPLITAPTEKVYEDTFKPVVDLSLRTMTSAKEFSTNQVNTAKDTINSVKTYSCDTISSAKNYSVDKANGLKDYTCTKIGDVAMYSMDKLDVAKTYGTEKLTEAAGTPYGKVAMQHVDGWVDTAEQYLDYYLPDDADKETEKEASVEKASVEKRDLEQHSGMAPLNRAWNLSNKARQRMYVRALRDLKNVQMRTKDSLDKLTFNVDLIQYAKTNMDNVHSNMSDMTNKLTQVWTEINASEEEAETLALNAEENPSTVTTFEKRAIATARHLTLRVKTGIHYITDQMAILPAPVTDRAATIKKYADDLYNSFSSVQSVSEVPDLVLTQTKERLGYLQETMSFLADYLQNAPIVNWMAEDDPNGPMYMVNMGMKSKGDVTDEIEMQALPPAEQPMEEIKAQPPNEEIKEKQLKEEIKEKQPKEEIKEKQPKEEIKEKQPKEEIKAKQPKEDIKRKQPKEEIKAEQPKEEIKAKQPKEKTKADQHKEDKKSQLPTKPKEDAKKN